MPPTDWTLRFDGYLPVDHRLEERLARLVEEFERLPDAAIRLDPAARVITVDCSRVPGWQEAARGVVRTLRVGRRLVIKPLWESYEAGREDVVVEIDAEGVFGSGMHETTALCLELLESNVTPGSACIDFGTGSGILAIAAAKLGAARVTALDALPGAVAAARANVRSNGLEERVTAEVGDSPTCAGMGADLVVANVTAAVHRAHAAALFGALRKGGLLVASGINLREAPKVTAALSAAGFQVEEQVMKGQWVGLVATAGRGPGGPDSTG